MFIFYYLLVWYAIIIHQKKAIFSFCYNLFVLQSSNCCYSNQPFYQLAGLFSVISNMHSIIPALKFSSDDLTKNCFSNIFVITFCNKYIFTFYSNVSWLQYFLLVKCRSCNVSICLIIFKIYFTFCSLN